MASAVLPHPRVRPSILPVRVEVERPEYPPVGARVCSEMQGYALLQGAASNGGT